MCNCEIVLLKANSQLNNGILESHWNISHSLYLCSSPEGDTHLVSLQTVLVKFLGIQQMGKGLSFIQDSNKYL